MRCCGRPTKATTILVATVSLQCRWNTCCGFQYIASSLPQRRESRGGAPPKLPHLSTTSTAEALLVRVDPFVPCCRRNDRRFPTHRRCETRGVQESRGGEELRSESSKGGAATTGVRPDGINNDDAADHNRSLLEDVPAGSGGVAPAPSSIDDLSSDEAGSKLPSYRTLIRFLSATSLIWLSEPLLSLVDTSFVGWSRPTTAVPGRMSASSTLLQLAAMGPATTYMDTMLYLTYFLAIATTNQVAEHLASRRYRELQLCTSRLLGVALVCGGLGLLLTWTAGGTILRHLSGASGLASPDLLSLATAYARLRATAAPLSVLGMVAQSFCLVTGRSSAVAVSVGVASVTNLIGDALWTPRHGLCGAAAATAIASSAGAAVLVRQVVLQLREWRRIEQDTDPSSLSTLPVVPLVSLPDGRSLRQLARLSLPLCFRMWALMGSYAALTLRAADLGATALAAQNLLVRVFYLLCAVPDSLGQATQVFVPPTLYPRRNATALRHVVKRLRIVAALAGSSAAVTALVLLSPWGAVRFLGYQARLAAQLLAAAPYLALSLVLHPFVTVTEGLVLAQRDFANVLKTYTVSVALLGVLLRWKSGSLGGVWRSLVLWQMSRLCNYWLWQRGPEPEAEKAQSRKFEPITGISSVS